jgi:hypothetical protein
MPILCAHPILQGLDVTDVILQVPSGKCMPEFIASLEQRLDFLLLVDRTDRFHVIRPVPVAEQFGKSHFAFSSCETITARL